MLFNFLAILIGFKLTWTIIVVVFGLLGGGTARAASGITKKLAESIDLA
jgi:hypothetical protein